MERALFLVAILSFIPVAGLLDAITGSLARVAPSEAISLLTDQVLKIAHEKNGGLLTLGMLGTIWSSSSGVTAIISALNQAYDVTDARPSWRVRLIAIGLTIALAVFIVVSFSLVLVIVLLLWFYASGVAVLVGAELNSEIEHAAPQGKAPGEKVPGENEIPKSLDEQQGPQRVRGRFQSIRG